MSAAQLDLFMVSSHDKIVTADEDWMPLSTFDAIPSTPIINKIGITNPSPAAYYYLDIMTRNKNIIFDMSMDDNNDQFDDNYYDDYDAISVQSCNSSDSGLAGSQVDYLYDSAVPQLEDASIPYQVDLCTETGGSELPQGKDVGITVQVDLISPSAHDGIVTADEDWMPLSILDAIPSTPILNKIGITNPSPAAYYYLDIMTRNKKIIFDMSIGDVNDPFDDDYDSISVQSCNSRDSGLAGSREELDYDSCAGYVGLYKGRDTHSKPMIRKQQEDTNVTRQQRGQKRCRTQIPVVGNTGSYLPPRSKRLCKNNVPKWRN